MDSAWLTANGRDGGGKLSPLLTQTFQANNIAAIIYQNQNLPQCLAKEQKGSPM